MNGTHNLQVEKLAEYTTPLNWMLGQRKMIAYKRTDGTYSVRLFLPPGEMTQHEVLYAYRGSDVEVARNAWRRVRKEWAALEAQYSQHMAEARADIQRHSRFACGMNCNEGCEHCC